MTLRRLLFLIGGLGIAGVAMLLWSGTSYAQTTTLPVDPMPAVGPTVGRVVEPAPVVAVVRRAPVAAPIVTQVSHQAHVDPPIALPIVSDVLAPTGPSSSAPHSVDRVRSHPTRAASRASSSSTVGARPRTGAAARPISGATVSGGSEGSSGSAGAVALFASRGVPSGLAAGGSTNMRGDTSAASIASVGRVVAAGWKPFDLRSNPAPRPGIARNLSPPG